MSLCSKCYKSTRLLCSSRVLVLILHSQTSSKLHILCTVIETYALKFRGLKVEGRIFPAKDNGRLNLRNGLFSAGGPKNRGTPERENQLDPDGRDCKKKKISFSHCLFFSLIPTPRTSECVRACVRARFCTSSPRLPRRLYGEEPLCIYER